MKSFRTDEKRFFWLILDKKFLTTERNHLLRFYDFAYLLRIIIESLTFWMPIWIILFIWNYEGTKMKLCTIIYSAGNTCLQSEIASLKVHFLAIFWLNDCMFDTLNEHTFELVKSLTANFLLFKLPSKSLQNNK